MNTWPNFSDAELNCRCCGEPNPNLEFIELMDIIQDMRTELGFPFAISSGYRCSDHPEEAKKKKPGQHNIAAVDIKVDRERAHQVLELAFKKGFKGIGINQKGNGRFIHLDMRDYKTIWSY